MAFITGHLQQSTNGTATVVSAHSGLCQWCAQAPCNLGGWAVVWYGRRMLLASPRQVSFTAVGMRGPEWKVLSYPSMPGFEYDFIRKALWLKLHVAEQFVAVNKSSAGAFDGQPLSHIRFLEQCLFARFIASAVPHSYGKVVNAHRQHVNRAIGFL